MNIIEVTENKKEYLTLLLLADEQEDMIDRYFDKGKMYVLEIKNIATVPEYQGKGYAKALLQAEFTSVEVHIWVKLGDVY